MNDLTIFSQRLKEAREKKGFTQRYLAEKVSVTPASLSAYEKGTSIPSLPVVKKLSEVCDVSIDWLCGLTENENNSIKSYKDVIAQLFRVFPPEFKVIKDSKSGNHILVFEDAVMGEFFKEWFKMRDIYKDDLIDTETYNLWKEKTLKKYDLPINYIYVPCRENTNTPFDCWQVYKSDDKTMTLIDEIPWSFTKDSKE